MTVKAERVNDEHVKGLGWRMGRGLVSSTTGIS